MAGMDTPPARPELLAPAGDWEALRAACANGADAVYFGLSHFNARARAANFTPDELPEVMAFLHARNVRGFVALNTLIFPDELSEVADLVKLIAAAGVDAVIVQDLGLVRLIKRMAPSLHVHASTQMTLTEPRGISFAKRLGVDRVVLARELSLVEIQKVTAGIDMPVEVFVHGALCVAYSGQCLTSEALGGRSANRGQCAQACRLPYEMIVDGGKRDLGDKAYLLSPQDLAAYDHIDDLIAAGVTSFKIEGRLKGGPYVAATCQTYRKAIDAALANRPFEPSRKEELDLAQTFSRGLTPGFLEGNDHQKLVRGRFPKSRGVRLGTVVGFNRHGVQVQLAEQLPVEDLIRPGDGVLFDLGRPDTQEPGGRIWSVRLAATQSKTTTVIEIQFEPESLDLSKIPLNCEVWKTDDPALKKRLEQSYSQNKPAKRASVRAIIHGEIGGSLSVTFTDGHNQSSTAAWPGPLELATKRATTPEEIRDSLHRLGDTPFELADVVIKLPPGVLVPKSVLNDLRRQAVSALLEERTKSSSHSISEPNALEHLRSELSPTERSLLSSPYLTVLVRTLDQLDAVLAWQPPSGLTRPRMVYCDFEDLRRYADAVPKANAAGMPIGLATLRIQKPGEDGFHSSILRAKPDAVLIRTLGGLEYFKHELPTAELIGDFSLNVANDLTADLLVREGCSRLVPSFDLNWDQLAGLLRRYDPLRFEPVIHQHMPMFHMEHCVFAAFLSKGKDHRDCGRPCDRHKVDLKDRVGAHFPVTPDTGCRNTVFNSVPQSAAEYVGRMRDLGVRTFRIDLLRETAEQVGLLLDNYSPVIAGADDGRATWKSLKALNQLGVTRGTLQLV